MIWDVFKRNRPVALPHASHVAFTAQQNYSKRMDEMLASVRQDIDVWAELGYYHTVYEHTMSPHRTAELVRILQQQGYVTKTSHDPPGTYISWYPVAEQKDESCPA